MPHRATPEGERPQNAFEQCREGAHLLTRRRFLSYGSGLLGMVIGAALGLPLVRFFVGDAFRARKLRWLKLGPVSEVKAGRPHLFRASHLDRDGWRQLMRREAFYVVTQEGREFVVFSNACTHLGCPVSWNEEEKLFLCPCHNGAFSLDGEVVKGPPPRPLDRVEHTVEGGVLYVRVTGA